MRKFFLEFTNGDFTNRMEKNLDLIANGNLDSNSFLLKALKEIDEKIFMLEDKIDYISLLKEVLPEVKCCSKISDINFSFKKFFFFYRCSICEGVMPIDYKFINLFKTNEFSIKKYF